MRAAIKFLENIPVYLHCNEGNEGGTFNLIPFSDYSLSQVMPPLLGTSMEFFIQNNLQYWYLTFLNDLDVLKYLSVAGPH